MDYATYKMTGVALAIQYNLPYMDLSEQIIDGHLRELVPVNIARRWRVIPISLQQGVLTIAIADPTDDGARDQIREMTGLTVIHVVSTPQDISRALDRFYEPKTPRT
jgi:type IV pilus assembly protein PilB